MQNSRAANNWMSDDLTSNGLGQADAMVSEAAMADAALRALPMEERFEKEAMPHSNDIFRTALRVVGDRGRAEDVAQEAFVRAFRNLKSFRGESRFYTWLYHIVVRVCLDRRKLARWRFEAPAESLDVAVEQTPAADERMVVEMLLDRLSPPIRAALVLRELEGLEYEEIAQVLEIPIGTVRSRLSAARKQFRAMWVTARRETDDV